MYKAATFYIPIFLYILYVCMYICNQLIWKANVRTVIVSINADTDTGEKKYLLDILTRKALLWWNCNTLSYSVHAITGINISTAPRSCIIVLLCAGTPCSITFLSLLFHSPSLLNEQWFHLFIIPLRPVFLHARNTERSFSVWSIFPEPSIFPRLFQVKKNSYDSYD